MSLWGGRFSESPDEVLWSYTVSHADRRLLVCDVRGSLAHVAMLGETGILTEGDVAALAEGLGRVLAEAEAGRFVFEPGDEDVHSAVERRLGALVGPVAGKLPTGRSRNDQVALDLRLYLVEAAARRVADLVELVETIAQLVEAHADTIVSSYTHLQQAQAISLGHHLATYGWWALRDADRFADAARRIAVSPLGAGASGGSSLPLDPEVSAARLGLPATFANSLDAVAGRDFVTEYAFCATQAMVHLSRLAEEVVMWSSVEFGWVTLADRHTTGSSALPHKKNPDVAELARGRAAGAIGSLTALLILQKALPLAYNRDLQEDKEHIFTLDDTLAATVPALAALLGSARFHPPAPSSWTTALDLAEAMVGRGVAFREAHAAVGRLVAALMGDDRELATASIADLTAADHRFDPADLDLVDPTVSASRRRSPGGGSPQSARHQAEALRRAAADRRRAPEPT